MKIALMSTDAVVARWDEIKPIFDRSVLEASHGELETDDILAGVLRGDAVIVAGISEAGAIEVVAAFNEVIMPRMRILSMYQVAGSGRNVLDSIFNEGLFDLVKKWAAEMGYDAIDGYVAPAMQRICERYGFRKIYSHIRINLKEEREESWAA